MFRLGTTRAALAGVLTLASVASAQGAVIPVYPGAAPESEQWAQREVGYRNPQGEAMVRNVVRPTLTPYLPAKAMTNGTAVVVAPGGGFRWHAAAMASA